MTTFKKLPPKPSKTNFDLNSTQNLVDPQWETLDPTPNIFSMFSTFNNKFFAGRLSCVEVEWSTKMYQCAGICYSRRNQMGMACVIRLSEPLLKLRSRKDLVETLLHEMIHAWNFIRGILEENGGHGKNFLSKMHEINRQAGTNISVYHTFHDEVNLYKKHWWRCDGVCKNRSPYYGFVKRVSNRTPGPNDFWWKQHESSCGGKFIKVKEPEKLVKGKENKKKEKKSIAEKKMTTSPGLDIRKFFKPNGTDDKQPTSKGVEVGTNLPSTSKAREKSSSGITLGGKNSGRSRLLDYFDTKDSDKTESQPKKRKLFDPSDGVIHIQITTDTDYTSLHDSMKAEFDDDVIFIDDEFNDNFPKPVQEKEDEIIPIEICSCPVCNISVATGEINQHLDLCLGM
ncbi:CLUMA_CG020461, isoform A [Clunio marinus]|uniref:CLUMA_CG020461, isoform A n=1 Tax=Clunio marinus TaxID=568069 RepID=A0A1J1J7P6_9DIPT|nr:CLUMA_CG020461, isoform A [Clunio marinus]